MGLRDRLKRRLRGRSEPAPKPPSPAPAPRRPAYRADEPPRVETVPVEETVFLQEPEPELAPIVAAPQDSPEGPGFPVRLLNEDEGLDLTIQVFEGEFVLDAADREGLDLPYSCRNGGCTVCTGRLIEGEARMSDDQYTLEEEHVAAGFRLLCCAEVRGPATFLTHQSEEI